jgi:hypothetical protein
LTLYVCMGFEDVVTFAVQQMTLIVGLEISLRNTCMMGKEYWKTLVNYKSMKVV